jgi:hypothetical protein
MSTPTDPQGLKVWSERPRKHPHVSGVGKQAHDDDQSYHDQSGYQVLRHGCRSK